MNPKEFTDAWGRFTSGEQLSEAEIRAMEQMLEMDAALRTEVAEDHHLHRMLQSMGSIHESQNDFVSGVVAACAGVDNPFAPLLKDGESGSRKPWKLVAALCLGFVISASVLVSFLYSKLGQARADANLAMQVAQEARQQAEHATKLTEAQAKRDQLTRQIESDDAAQKKELAARTEPEKKIVQAPKPAADVGEQSKLIVETIALVAGADDESQWRGNIVENRMSAGEYELLSGEAILRMSHGSIVQVLGPAKFTLHHASHMSLHEGEMEVQVAPDDVGFRVTTENSRVIDLGTMFQVSVTKGQTRVRLDGGEVAVIPWQSPRSDTRYYLRGGELEEAVVFGTGDDNGLHASYGSGPSGFEGFVRLGDSSFRLTSLERFNHVFNSVRKRYESNAVQTRTAWQRARMVLARVSGKVKFGGKDFTFDSLDDVLRVEQQFVRVSDPATLLREKDFAVTGQVTVVGKQHQFRSRIGYDELRERILEPLDALGIRTVMDVQQEQDQKTNPFGR